jgi:hypothetical protein
MNRVLGVVLNGAALVFLAGMASAQFPVKGTSAAVANAADATLAPLHAAEVTTTAHSATAAGAGDATNSIGPTGSVPPTPVAGFPNSNHVFVVMEENQGFSEIFPFGNATGCTSSAMPYLCSLAASNGMALQFYANDHGSLRDYLYTTSAFDWTQSPYNCTPSNCASPGVISGDNLVRALTAASKTWRGYFEDMPWQGYIGGDTANYVVNHNPFIWYSDVANSTIQQSNMFPFTQFAQDVNANTFQNFSYIVPNQLDDAHGIHDALENGSETSSTLLSAADTWLRTNIAPLLSTAPFRPGGDGILIIVFDEAQEAGESGATFSDNSCSLSQSSGCGGHVAFVMAGPKVLAGSTTNDAYHFQDMVHTIIHLLGMSDYMNTANGAADIALFP